MSDQVGNHKDWFSHVGAQIIPEKTTACDCCVPAVVMGIENTYTALLCELAFTATRSVSGYSC